MSSYHKKRNFQKSLYSYNNNINNIDIKKSQENKRMTIMNELLISHPDLLENFRRRHSKTPCRLRMKSPLTSKSNSNILDSKKLSPRETTNLKLKLKLNKNNPQIRKQNIKQKNFKKNFREMNTSPLIRHINVQGEKRTINILKDRNQNKKKNKYISNSQKKERNNIKQKKDNNVLSRSESFSILDIKKNNNNKDSKELDNSNNNNFNLNKKEENKEKENDNKNNNIKEQSYIIDNKENNQNNNNKDNDYIIKSKTSDFINENNDNNSNSQKKINEKNKVNKKIYKIESLSQVGYSGPGILKYNQDNFFVYKNLNDENNVLFIGVCDGHGLVGHDVSKYLINNLPKNLNQELKKTNKYIADRKTLYSTMKKVFISTNKDLCKNPNIDTQFSGSTCVTIILTKNKIISGNAGDSRAVMGRYINGEWTSIDLSHDQKPNNPGEKERILAHGGRIEAYKDENGGDFGPPRVWLKYEDVPGLAMSRSFGDEIAASVGTISEPEIEEYDITNDDKFIIIASDGIWEFISSQECVNFIKDFYLKKDLKGCLKFLLNESSKRWIKEEEVIDDITAVLIFFED